jgi:hypothetical protein
MIAELLGPNDFTTDDEGSNNDNDDRDSCGEVKISRRKMKNIRQKRRSSQNTPKKKKKTVRSSSTARLAQPTFLIKDILSRDKQDQIGARRLVPSERKRQRAGTQKGEKNCWALPPLPILKSSDKILMDSEMVSDKVSELVL